jgi:hypothetical protein
MTRSAVLPALVAVALVLGQGLWASEHESQTWDEAMGLASGFAQVEQGRLDLATEWPPLLGLLTWLPLTLNGATLPELPPLGAPDTALPGFGQRFLYDGSNRPLELLRWSRFAVLLLTLAAVGTVVAWAHRLHGTAGAWLAAVLCAFEPNWLAHGHLTAWDGIATSTFTLALFAAASFLDRPGAGRAALAGAALGLALSAKFTTLLLAPIFVALLCLTRPRAGAWRIETAERDDLGIGRLVALAGLGLAAALLVLGLSYNGGFRFDLFLAAAGNIYGMTAAGFDNYLLGQFQEDPFFHYYVVAWLAKSPVAFLVLVVAGAVATVRWGRRALWAPAAAAVALLFTVTMFDPLDIGIRRVLPAVPATLVLASGAVRWGRRAAPLGVAVWLLAGLGAAETLARAPYYLSFFNVIAGGPSRGIEVLDASNIDWGQDLVALAALQEREGLGKLALRYHGSADPAAWGVAYRPMRPGEEQQPRPGVTYAISVHKLNRMRRSGRPGADWWARYTPWRVAGNSLYLYRF